MTGWDKVMVQYMEGRKKLICPDCGKDTVRVEKYVGEVRDSFFLDCTNCGSYIHYDGAMRK